MKKSKPRLSFWQIWNMSFGFLGIQFGFALQNANVSRIFETLGCKGRKYTNPLDCCTCNRSDYTAYYRTYE